MFGTKSVARATVVSLVVVGIGVAPAQVQRPAFAVEVETLVEIIDGLESEAIPPADENEITVESETSDDGRSTTEERDAVANPSGEKRSKAIESPIPFSMIGFEALVAGDLVFRVSVDGEAWEPWQQAAFFDTEDGPDGREEAAAPDPTRFTEPIWVGEANFVQVITTDLRPDEIKAHVIDSMGLSRTLIARALSFTKAAFRAPSPVAAHAASQPQIVTRAQWGADERLRKESPSYADDVEFAVVHHTAGSNDYTALQAPGVVRGIYHYHTQALGWSDVGYNVMIDKYGVIYEGRFGGMGKGVIGAHARNYNTGSFGVSVIGNYDLVKPTGSAVTALNQILAWKLDVHDIDPAVVPSRAGVNNAIIGHRDVGQTVCPGRYIYELLPTIRSAVTALTETTALSSDRPPSGATPFIGDWNGDGVDTPAWYKDGTWALYTRDGKVTRLTYGRAGDLPVVGDFNGDGIDTIGVVRTDPDGRLRFILRYAYRSGADIVMHYGRHGDIPVIGDWNGNGIDTLGVVRADPDGRLRFILRYEYRSGADIVMHYGRQGDIPLVGDFNGDGTDTLGVVRDAQFILRYVYKSGSDIVMTYGRATDQPLIGDFNGDGTDTLGIRRADLWALRYAYRSGADIIYYW